MLSYGVRELQTIHSPPATSIIATLTNGNSPPQSMKQFVIPAMDIGYP